MEETTAAADNALGDAYEVGHGVSQSYMQAADLYRKAAGFGNIDAQRNLGELYENGGVLTVVGGPSGKSRVVTDGGGGAFPKDYALAADWYKKAAEQGDYAAQNDLGLLYDSGQGVPQDYAEAYFWLSLAAATAPGLSANRDNAASNLTKTVLLQTQVRTRKWLADHPRPVDPQ